MYAHAYAIVTCRRRKYCQFYFTCGSIHGRHTRLAREF